MPHPPEVLFCPNSVLEHHATNANCGIALGARSNTLNHSRRVGEFLSQNAGGLFAEYGRVNRGDLPNNNGIQREITMYNPVTHRDDVPPSNFHVPGMKVR